MDSHQDKSIKDANRNQRIATVPPSDDLRSTCVLSFQTGRVVRIGEIYITALDSKYGRRISISAPRSTEIERIGKVAQKATPK